MQTLDFEEFFYFWNNQEWELPTIKHPFTAHESTNDLNIRKLFSNLYLSKCNEVKFTPS